MFVQEGHIWPHITHVAPERAEVAIPLHIIQAVKVFRRLVIEGLALVQRSVRVRELGDPYGKRRIRAPDLAEVGRQALEVAVPVYGDEVRVAAAIAGLVERLQPGEAAGGARDGRQTEFDAFLPQGFELRDPGLSGQGGGEGAGGG